jgi:hypothetical protein
VKRLALLLVLAAASCRTVAADRRLLADAGARYAYHFDRYSAACVKQVGPPPMCATFQFDLGTAWAQLQSANRAINQFETLPKIERVALAAAMKKLDGDAP